jgi:deferrochelatase/peroxidase EfeB
LAAAGAGLAAERSRHESGAENGLKAPFFGRHQSGIATAAQVHLQLAAFDLTISSAPDLQDLLAAWSTAGAALTDPQHRSNVHTIDGTTLTDSGHTLAGADANLTLTFGLGASVFTSNGQARFGLAPRMPPALKPLPGFTGDQLDPRRSDGDLCVQACADDPIVAFHAVRALARIASGAATMRWSQAGLLPNTGPSERPVTPRNLLGFKDGTSNIANDDHGALRQHVWVNSGDGPPWMVNGTYMVIRRIRMNLDSWDALTTAEQERIIGRQKATGAPLSGGTEHTPPQLNRQRAGSPTIPADAHIRLASPTLNHQQRILRRSYTYTDGIDPGTRQPDAGLVFICFQRDPHAQFAAIQQRLSAHDALNNHISHTASALYACPPGVQRGQPIAQRLFV